MKVIWQTGAEKARVQIADYILRRFGYKYKEKFLQEVRQTTKMLKQHPNIGSIDPLFADRQKTYRSVIIEGLSKMVYCIEDDSIHIAAFWDCRQEPENQITQISEKTK